MHKKTRIRTLTVLLALIMSFIPVTVTNAATTDQESTTSSETADQDTTTKKAKASAKFKNKNLSFKKSDCKKATLIIKNLKVSKVKATLKNNKATVKSIELKEKEATTTIIIELAGNSIGKDKLTVEFTTDSGRKITRRCNVNVTAPKQQETKKDTPKKSDKPKKDKSNEGINIGGIYISPEAIENAKDVVDSDKLGIEVDTE